MSAKDIAALIIGKPKGSVTKEADEFETIAADIISAVESKDAQMLGSALKAFVSACESEPHYEGGDEGEM